MFIICYSIIVYRYAVLKTPVYEKNNKDWRYFSVQNSNSIYQIHSHGKSR